MATGRKAVRHSRSWGHWALAWVSRGIGGDVTDDRPFAHPGLRRRILPFALAAVAAECSLPLSYGVPRFVPTLLSAILLVVTAALVLLPWDRLPRAATPVVPIVYMGSLLCLVTSPAELDAGFGPVVLIPLLWTALYHRRRDALAVVVAVVPYQVISAMAYPGSSTDPAIVRRTVSWTVLAAVLIVAIHALRGRHQRSMSDETDLRLQTSALVGLAQELTVIFEPDEVLRAGTKALTDLASQTTRVPVRSQYFEVHEGQVVVRIEFDPNGQRIGRTWALDEQPWLADVIRTGRPRMGRIPLDVAGPIVREVVGELQLTHAIWIPVLVQSEVRGVLCLSTRGAHASARLMELACAIGNLVELALGNALTHQTLRQQAITDPLTGLVNRRGFEQIVSTGPVGNGFAVLVIDLDNLKRINDTHGHEAGDELLVAVSGALRAVVRHGDVLARMGGDEFAAILGNVTEENAARTAERMVEAVGQVRLHEIRPSISVGVAWSDADPEVALRAADAAMYQAKRDGGAQWTMAALPVGKATGPG